MIVSTWNVNSVRARIENILEYLNKFLPDILIMQEIKTENINFPIDDFKKLKYESYIFGQKSYNGVAILSKVKLENINTNLIKDKLVDRFYLFQSLRNLPETKIMQNFTSFGILSRKYKKIIKISSKLAKDNITIYKR